MTKYDGKTWTVFKIDNHGFPTEEIRDIKIDRGDKKWLGTYNGLTEFDEKDLITYNISNSGLPSKSVRSIPIDDNDYKWIGTYDKGLVKYNGTDWTVYDTSNSVIPSNNINSLTIDEKADKWIGTTNGLTKYNGTKWTIFNTSNSVISSNFIVSLTINVNGNKWIGTNNGLVVFNELGVVFTNVNKNDASPSDFILGQNYPNPFNQVTNITIEIPKTSKDDLSVYNMQGELVKKNTNKEYFRGVYKFEFDGESLGSGIYFIRLKSLAYMKSIKVMLLK